jgi:hypothetical protein
MRRWMALDDRENVGFNESFRNWLCALIHTDTSRLFRGGAWRTLVAFAVARIALPSKTPI